SMAINSYRFGVAAWPPKNIAGIKCWFDAADAPTLSVSSGKVSEGRDKSGNGYHVPASGAARPASPRDAEYFRCGLRLEAATRMGLGSNPDLIVIGVLEIKTTAGPTAKRVAQVGGGASGSVAATQGARWGWRFNNGNALFETVDVGTYISAHVRVAGT